jgi:hypothetical protein
MAILSKGTDFSTGDQVTAAKLDALVDSATFASGAVDDSTTQLDGNGKIIVKDGGITTAKLNLSGGIVQAGAFRAAQGVPNAADNSTTGFAFSTDGDTGIFCTGTSGAAAGGDIAILSNNARRVTIDTSGRFGIGTTSPASTLDVVGTFGINGPSDPAVMGRYVADGTGPFIFLDKSRNATVGSHTVVQDNDRLGGIVFRGSDGTEFEQGAQISAVVDGTPGTNDMPGRLEFATTPDGANSPTARMTIKNDGKVGIGTTGPSSELEVVGDILINNGGSDGGQLILASAGNNTMQIDNESGNFRVVNNTLGTELLRIDNDGDLAMGSTSTGGSSFDGNSIKLLAGQGQGIHLSRNITTSANQITFHNNNGQVGFINTEGSATIYSTSSDYRLKEDIVEMQDSISKVQSLKPVNFAWKVDGTRVDGFLAHEAQEIVPEAVTGTKDAVDEDGQPKYQGIDQSKLVPLLTKALQEALTKIETLEARVSALES